MTGMAEIDADEVLRIAHLAHLTLDAGELERMTTELDAILAFVRQLEAVDVDAVPPTAHVELAALPLRADLSRPSFAREVALDQAPATHDGSFAVPAFVDEG